MSVDTHQCISLRCDECRQPFEYDGVTQHWDAEDVVEARNNAADCDWGIADEGEWCPPCWARKACERFGHVPALDVRGEYCDRCEEKLNEGIS
jgi:hypothetical protein